MLFHYSDFPRFWSKGGIGAPNECWPWTASLTTGGYGQFEWQGKTQYAHRVAYTLMIGSIPEGLQLDHLCRTRHCVNVRHLEAVTSKVNALRGVGICAQNARLIQCPAGHLYSKDNTYIYPNSGARRCRTCRRIQQRIQQRTHNKRMLERL